MTVTRASFLTARTRSARQGFGSSIPRKEDPRLVTGGGRFGDDFNLPSQAHAHLVRSGLARDPGRGRSARAGGQPVL